jgi:hypothetical protein
MHGFLFRIKVQSIFMRTVDDVKEFSDAAIHGRAETQPQILKKDRINISPATRVCARFHRRGTARVDRLLLIGPSSRSRRTLWGHSRWGDESRPLSPPNSPIIAKLSLPNAGFLGLSNLDARWPHHPATEPDACVRGGGCGCGRDHFTSLSPSSPQASVLVIEILF